MSLVSFARRPSLEPTDRSVAAASAVFAFPAAARLSALLYFAAVITSLSVGLRPTVLIWVPVCFCIALVLSAGSRILFGDFVWLAAGIEGAFLICSLGLSLACLSYVCAALNLPLWDSRIRIADSYFGFSWLALAQWIDHAPVLLHIFDAAYATFTAQLILTAVLLLIAGRLHDIDRYFVTFICASILAETASLLVPTLGPASSMAADVRFEHLAAIGRTTGDIVLALRAGTLKVIDARALDGIISFPSLHAAVAVLIPYHFRWNKSLFWAAVVLNALMLASAIPCGNHYLMDILGGAAIAGLAILCSTVLHPRLFGPTPCETFTVSSCGTERLLKESFGTERDCVRGFTEVGISPDRRDKQ